LPEEIDGFDWNAFLRGGSNRSQGVGSVSLDRKVSKPHILVRNGRTDLTGSLNSESGKLVVLLGHAICSKNYDVIIFRVSTALNPVKVASSTNDSTNIPDRSRSFDS
jgi:hypothetical protein